MGDMIFTVMLSALSAVNASGTVGACLPPSAIVDNEYA